MFAGQDVSAAVKCFIIMRFVTFDLLSKKTRKQTTENKTQ